VILFVRSLPPLFNDGDDVASFAEKVGATIGRFLGVLLRPLAGGPPSQGTRPQPSPAPPPRAPGPARLSGGLRLFFRNYVADRRVAEQARGQFESLAMKAAHGDADALLALPAAASNARELYKTNWKYGDAAWSALSGALHDHLADDVLTEQEEAHLDALASAFGVQVSDLAGKNHAMFEEYVVARINDGHPLPDDSTPLIAHAGETAYYPTFKVDLMKEVVDREMRGHSSGVSVRIAKGVTYRIGQVRAHSVVIGTHLEAEDSGSFVVTDRRAVFIGSRKTLEFRRDRLVGLDQYGNGLRLNVSNRQAASLLRFERRSSPSIAAALLARA
jgi:hypothetical protein